MKAGRRRLGTAERWTEEEEIPSLQVPLSHGDDDVVQICHGDDDVQLSQGDDDVQLSHGDD